jgi:hypothetical protein
MALQSISQGPYIKGLVASNQPLAIPKGSVARISNLLYSTRGALTVVDGTLELYEYNGAIQTGRGAILATFLYKPAGVVSYYLVMAQALDQPLGAPQNLTASASGSGGTLPAATYYYKVTALDGVGGETTAANEVSVAVTLGEEVTLTWNVVPNAAGYNVYRATSSGNEVLLSSSSLPAGQVAAGILSVSFTDLGSNTTVSGVYALLVSNGATEFSGLEPPTVFQFATAAQVPQSYVGKAFLISGVTPSSFNATYPQANVIVSGSAGSTVICYISSPFTPNQNVSGGGGTVTFAPQPPTSDTTQQVVLFKMPALLGNPAVAPVSYNNSNIVALFPIASPYSVQVGGASQSSSGGGGGSGGSGGGGVGGGGGRGPITLP